MQYAPSNALWVRELDLRINRASLIQISVDGQPTHGFSHEGTLIQTHLDNERIQVDLSTGLWRSEFRDRAKGEGMCTQTPPRSR